jgi:hypothetical protein
LTIFPQSGTQALNKNQSHKMNLHHSSPMSASSLIPLKIQRSIRILQKSRSFQ